ncbi:MAG TPA: sulfurtransferase TusA family protein [Syntrophales bacterium]|jgi:TusA-related sulfurtransferase|nr:sulfurtransferase TusA family protein [Syntrophales bacterium]HPX56212.1 sulfurtransferase TusA family protein [Syntrophales bacterium]HQA82397.1 sulfurtransferase TusA family protein [Syntrophales bacterium]
MSAVVDARGLSCPQPVMMTLNRIEALGKGVIEVLVDTDTSMENVARLAKNKGWSVKEIQDEGTGYKLVLEK